VAIKPKRPADMNKLAKSIVDIATGEKDYVASNKGPAEAEAALEEKDATRSKGS